MAKGLGFSLELPMYAISKTSKFLCLRPGSNLLTKTHAGSTFSEGMLAQKHRGSLGQSPITWEEQGGKCEKEKNLLPE